MNAADTCNILPRVAAPLCRMLLDPVAAYILVACKPRKLTIFPLFLSKHRDDMYTIMEALSVDLAGRPFLEGVASIPAKTLHELACLVSDVYEGIANR